MPSTIVGRERESSRLGDCLNAAIAGRGSLVLVAGETGIGKSTLLARLASEAREQDVAVLTGAADVLPSAPPYSPWIDLFRNWSADSRLPALPKWIDLGSSIARTDTRGTLFHEIYQLFARVASGRPLLVILEDLHRADSASLELLGYLNRRLHNLSVLIACSIRTDEMVESLPLYHFLPELAREDTMERIQLGRLDDVAVRTLISDRYHLPEDDEERITRYIQERAEGNPLFVTELLRVLEEEQILDVREGEWTLGTLDRVPISPLVRQIIDGRLRHLDDEVRRLIGIAALIGRNVPFDTLRQVTGAGDWELENAVTAATEQNVVYQSADGSVAFSHALVREVLEAGIILPRRRNLHRQIAEALIAGSERAADMDQIAYHLWSARDSRAAEWLVRAGERASNVYAYEEAEQRLNRALAMSDGMSDRLRIQALRLRGTAREMTGRFDQAIEDRQAALSLAKSTEDPREIWQSLIELGDLWTSRDYREVEVYYQQALDLARETADSRMLAHSLNRMGNWYTNIDQPQDGLQYHEEAQALFQRTGDDAGVARSLDLKAIASYLHGDMVASAEYYRHAVRLFREQQDRHGLASGLPTLMLTGGSYDSETVNTASGSDVEWLRLGDEGLAVAREIGWRAVESFILAHFGLALGPRGSYQRALDYAHQGLELASDIDHREWITAGHFALGVILVDCLNTSLARYHLKQARDSAIATHSLFWSRASGAAMAWAHLTDDDPQAAARALESAIDSSSGFDSISVRQCWFRRAELELARSNPNAALEIIDLLATTVPGAPASQSVPHLDWLRGRALTAIGQYREAEDALEGSRIRADELGYRPLLWRIDLALARLGDQVGHRQTTAEALTRGCEIVVELAGQIEDPSIRAGFQNRALPMFQRFSDATKREGYPFALSQREREVLRLVADGMTDGEVGEQLYISARTVGRHLQSIYNKLGVNSRTAAARVAIERNLIQPDN